MNTKSAASRPSTSSSKKTKFTKFHQRSECDTSYLPLSYSENTEQEQLILLYVNNFMRQFRQTNTDRKVPLLAAENEAGIKKMICSYVVRTPTCHYELSDWKGCSQFVADFFIYENLSNITCVPISVYSPITMFRRRKAHSFEMSCFLCSFLLGLGYDAYVVSGYATQDVCTACLDREDCPYVDEKESKEVPLDLEEISSPPSSSTHLKPFPLPQFSTYDQMIHDRVIKREALRKRKMKLQETASMKKQMSPSKDVFFGQRVHSWVLVRSGKKEIPRDFFIESSTGQQKSCHSEYYLGIESMWNDANLWMNCQNCADGVKTISFDLLDSVLWECFLPYIPPTVLPRLTKLLEEEQIETYDTSVHEKYDMPPSWIVPVTITSRDLQDRYPSGRKVELYKFVKVEKFAPYRRKDGVLMRLHYYRNWDRKGEILFVKEHFQRRSDKMYYKLHNRFTGMVTEYFMPGESHALLEHTFDPADTTNYAERYMTFGAHCRPDGLMSRTVDRLKLIDNYKKRHDFLIHRQTWFGGTMKAKRPDETERKQILQIYEKYDRDPGKEKEAIYEITYDLVKQKIKVVYHVEKDRITRSWRLFKKNKSYGKHAFDLFDLSQVKEYNADPQGSPLNRLEACLMLEELTRKEIIVINKVRQSEVEVASLVQQRLHEQTSPTLYVSPYNTAQNESKRRERLDSFRKEMEDQISREFTADVLLPYIVRHDVDPTQQLSKGQLQKVVNSGLTDYKQQLMDRYYIAYHRYTKTSEELKQLNEWYRKNLPNLSQKEVKEYESKCADLDIKIKITKYRLQQHRDIAPYKYLTFEKTARSEKSVLN